MSPYKYKLSIIIPMYNAEKYIANCLDSILNSNLPKNEFEVIIVNDGSKDKSPEIAQEYVSRNNNFVYLTQENHGQSVARNYGIRSCNGEYIWCVDSDDMVNNDLTDCLKSLQIFPEIDILSFEAMVLNEDGNKICDTCFQSNVPHNQILSGRDAIISGYNPSAVWALWIRRSLMIENDLFFKEGITHQDVELTYRLFAEANNVVFTDSTHYVYINHSDSVIHSIIPQKKIKYLSDDITIYQSFINLAQKHETDRDLAATIRNRAQNVLFSLVLSLYRHRKQWRSLDINREVIKRLKNKGLYPLHGPFDSWKKVLVSKVLNIESLIV
jgi:glycosyltransferase involved in cell wall biosynthesis